MGVRMSVNHLMITTSCLLFACAVAVADHELPFGNDEACMEGPLAQFGRYIGDWNIEDSSLAQDGSGWQDGQGARWIFSCLGNGYESAVEFQGPEQYPIGLGRESQQGHLEILVSVIPDLDRERRFLAPECARAARPDSCRTGEAGWRGDPTNALVVGFDHMQDRPNIGNLNVPVIPVVLNLLAECIDEDDRNFRTKAPDSLVDEHVSAARGRSDRRSFTEDSGR